MAAKTRAYNRRMVLGGLGAAGLVGTSVLGTGPARAAEALRVVTTTAMIGEPLASIAGDHARVESLLGAGVDPHLYRPTRSDITRLTRADIILYNGLTLEAQLERPIRQLSDRTAVLALAETLEADLWLPYEDGPGDPHVWMDPSLWTRALQAGVDLLAAQDPAHAEAYASAARGYFAQVAAMEAYGQDVLSSVPASARMLVTAHDAFSYFGARYGLEVRGIQGISTESEAGLRAVEELVDLLVERRIPAVFVETSVSDRQVRALVDGAAARGHDVTIGGSLFSDAMGTPGTYEGTYLGMIDHNVTTIARALGGEAPERGYAGRLGEGDRP